MAFFGFAPATPGFLSKFDTPRRTSRLRDGPSGSSCCRQETVVQNQGMDVPKLMEAASLLVAEETATENDITVNDVWEYLTRDEWEVALGLLEELGDV